MLKHFDPKQEQAKQYIDKESIGLVTQWALRFLVVSGAKTQLDMDKAYREEKVITFLGYGYYIDNDITQKEFFSQLSLSFKSENTKTYAIDTTLEKNITKLLNLINLNSCEKDIFVLAMYIHYYDVVKNMFDLLEDLTTRQTYSIISDILNYPVKEVKKALSSSSLLRTSGLVALDLGNTTDLKNKLDVLSDEFVDNMMSEDMPIVDMIKQTVKNCDKTTLTLKDYTHLDKKLDILMPYLKNALSAKTKGVNILLYGKPGTGKTELTKAIASALEVDVYEISFEDADGEALRNSDRLKGYVVAQSFLKTQPIVLMFDEAEDAFEDENGPFLPSKQKNKAWMNRLLENNPIPTVWISNSLWSMDDAIKRRFDIVVEVPIPPKAKRMEIIQHYSKGLLDQKAIQNIAQHEDIAPALISRAANVISNVKSSIEDTSKAFETVLESTLEIQGYKKIQSDTNDVLPKSYDPSLVNTNMDMQKLAEGIKRNPNARLCFYGVPGTGKSAFGHWLAHEIDKPFLLKKASDLISMFVGGTEKNIAKAFEEAKEEGAVLVFDEVDSFLQDRREAKNSWEVSQVNEMLVQMENYDGIFIATTNLMEGLDQASLRRFDLKLEFNYLTVQQAEKLFLLEAKLLGLRKPTKQMLEKLTSIANIAPGDFAAIRRQHRFNPLVSANDLVKRLQTECSIKEGQHKTLGFVAS